jgi:hypothetical protein
VYRSYRSYGPPAPDESDDDRPADEAVADRLKSLGYL